jgi:hypothetical protein
VDVLIRALYLIALGLLGTEMVGVERSARWEAGLRRDLVVTRGVPSLRLANAFRVLDWWFARALARFNLWKMRRGLDGMVLLMATLAGGGGIALSFLVR